MKGTTPKLACPKCHGFDSRVSDCRPRHDAHGAFFERRRYCRTCGRRFLTHERVVHTLPNTEKSSTTVNI